MVKIKTKIKSEVSTAANAVKMQSDKYWLFKKGQSGNPAGKLLGTKHASTKFQELLGLLDRKDRKTYLELFDKKMLELATKRGNVRMIEIILNYLYGKPITNFKGDLTNKYDGWSKEQIIEDVLGRIKGNR